VRMEQSTYLNREVQASLENWKRLKIDVTKTNDMTLKAKQYFKVFGPPATLFINTAGTEDVTQRRYGYIPASELIEILDAVANQSQTGATK